MVRHGLTWHGASVLLSTTESVGLVLLEPVEVRRALVGAQAHVPAAGAGGRREEGEEEGLGKGK